MSIVLVWWKLIVAVLLSSLPREWRNNNAEALFTATLATQQRVLGSGQLDTQKTAQELQHFQQRC